MADLATALRIAGELLVTETQQETRLATAAGSGTRHVAFSAVGDTCPLCQALDGKVFAADSDEARRFTPPLHINCDCIWTGVGDDEVGGLDRFTRGDETALAEVIEQHGHFVRDDKRYAPLRVPAGPHGRDFTFRRKRDANGEMVSEIEWHRPRYAVPELDAAVRQVGTTGVGERWATLRRDDDPAAPPPTAPDEPPPVLDGPGARARLRDLAEERRAEDVELRRQISALERKAERLNKRLQELTGEAWDDLYDQALDNLVAIKQLRDRRDGLQARVLERWREEVLFHPADAATTVRLKFTRTTEAARGVRRNGAEHFRRMVRAGRGLDSRTVTVASTPGGGSRAYCEFGGKTVRLSQYDEERTVVHELGHALEFSDAEVRRAARAFLLRRAAGADSRPLSEITGNRNYRANELAWEDDFLHPYMGKDYGEHATEIISMGMEYLYAEPERFAEHDPEYFDFIWGILRGAPL